MNVQLSSNDVGNNKLEVVLTDGYHLPFMGDFVHVPPPTMTRKPRLQYSRDYEVPEHQMDRNRECPALSTSQKRRY